MFAFLSILSIISLVASFLLLAANDIPTIVGLYFLFSSIINLALFNKLDTMEKRTQWLTDIAKEKGYKDPTEPTPTDIYSGDKKDGE